MEATAPPLPHLPSTTPSFRRVGRPAARLNSSKKREPKEKKKLTSLLLSPSFFQSPPIHFPFWIIISRWSVITFAPHLEIEVTINTAAISGWCSLNLQLTRNRWFLVFCGYYLRWILSSYPSFGTSFLKKLCCGRKSALETWSLNFHFQPHLCQPSLHTRRLPLLSTPHLLSTYLSLHHCLFLTL